MRRKEVHVAGLCRVILYHWLQTFRELFGVFPDVCKPHVAHISIHNGALNILVGLEIRVELAIIFLVLDKI